MTHSPTLLLLAHQSGTAPLGWVERSARNVLRRRKEEHRECHTPYHKFSTHATIPLFASYSERENPCPDTFCFWSFVGEE